MTKKKIILIFTVFVLTIVPIYKAEMPREAYAGEKVLGAQATLLALAEEKPKQVVAKPTVAKKPVVKKKAPVKKKVVKKKKERLIAAPPMITVETAPHSGKR